MNEILRLEKIDALCTEVSYALGVDRAKVLDIFSKLLEGKKIGENREN